MDGYPDLLQRDDIEFELPTSAEHVPGAPAGQFTLEPGKTGWVLLGWSTRAAGDETQSGDCEPRTASLLVTVPGDTAKLAVAANLGPVCDHGRISETPPGHSSSAGRPA
jgi:Protein of unknown function (DUF4232)